MARDVTRRAAMAGHRRGAHGQRQHAACPLQYASKVDAAHAIAAEFAMQKLCMSSSAPFERTSRSTPRGLECQLLCRRSKGQVWAWHCSQHTQ
eukprot:8206751-Pyramimonas_sp.AAC.1